jgi:hypothetical protein
VVQHHSRGSARGGSVQTRNVNRHEGNPSRCAFKWVLSRHPEKSHSENSLTGESCPKHQPLLEKKARWSLCPGSLGHPEYDFVSLHRIKFMLLEMLWSSVLPLTPTESTVALRCLRRPMNWEPWKERPCYMSSSCCAGLSVS